MEQLGLRLERRDRGGPRIGAGRPALPAGRRSVPHRRRPVHHHREPLHVTLRAATSELRAQKVFAAIRKALERLVDGHVREASFRVVQFSVQANHVHLIVEAADNRALTAGMRGLAVSVARRVNGVLRRSGALWRDRYHARALRSPRAVRNALVYVLNNLRKHDPRAEWIDPCSSAPGFDGWRIDTTFGALIAHARERAGPPAVAHAQTWLATDGWQRSGRWIGVDESPRPRR